MGISIKQIQPAVSCAFLVLIGSAMAVSSASAAVVTRTTYQNAGGMCHGEDNVSDSMLLRTENRLINKTSKQTAYVICNLAADTGANFDASYGQITYVTLWAKREQVLSGKFDNSTISCTMVTGYADSTYTQSVTHTSGTLPVAPTNNQAQIEWIPSNDTAGKLFFEPVNISCALPPKAELNDIEIDWNINT